MSKEEIEDLYADYEEAEDNRRDFQEKYLEWDRKSYDLGEKIKALGYDPNNYPFEE